MNVLEWIYVCVYGGSYSRYGWCLFLIKLCLKHIINFRTHCIIFKYVKYHMLTLANLLLFIDKSSHFQQMRWICASQLNLNPFKIKFSYASLINLQPISFPKKSYSTICPEEQKSLPWASTIHKSWRLLFFCVCIHFIWRNCLSDNSKTQLLLRQ